MKDYKITKVSETVKEWQSSFGPMVTYKVMVEGEADPVDINQKPETPAPAAGQEVYGSIEVSQYGKKLKKEKKPEGQHTIASTSAAPVRFDNRDDSITRQSALKSAVAVGETDPEKILKLADDFLVWLKNDAVPTVEETPLPEPQGEEIDIDDIPF